MANITGTIGNNHITGAMSGDTLRGLLGDDELNGSGGIDRLEGGGGDDTLSGGTGIDLLIGGGGNDTYIIDNVTEINKETADPGIDTVQSSVTYSLGANQEHLTLTGSAGIGATGNSGANILTGNMQANVLDGRGGNDTLNGGGGNDYLVGGTGDDKLMGGIGNDRFTFDAEDTRGVNGGADTDTLRVIGNETTADMVVLNGGLVPHFTNFEVIDLGAANTQTLLLDEETVLGLSGSTQTLQVLGTSDDAVLASGLWTNEGPVTIGNTDYTEWHSGLAVLQVQVGVDVSGIVVNPLDDTDGADVLNGTGEQDTFIFDNALGGGDIINNFIAADDVINLDASIFAGLTTTAGNPISDVEFEAAAGLVTAPDATTRILYDFTTGNLYYDADGNLSTTGIGAPVLFAHFNPAPGEGILTPADFHVI